MDGLATLREAHRTPRVAIIVTNTTPQIPFPSSLVFNYETYKNVEKQKTKKTKP